MEGEKVRTRLIDNGERGGGGSSIRRTNERGWLSLEEEAARG